MSDVIWQPFVLRRTTGGDLLRPDGVIQSALRFGPKDYPFDIVKGSTLLTMPWGYDAAIITVMIPPNVPHRGEMVLVRGGFGYPTTPLDGEVIWYHPDSKVTTPIDWTANVQVNQQVLDQPLTEGRWYYYTCFICVVDEPYPQPGEWMVAAVGKVLVPRNYHHAIKLYEMLPEFYRKVDDNQAADGRTGPLRRYLSIIGYDCDYNRTLLDGVLNIYEPDLAPLEFTQQLGANLGLPLESALGGARYRSLVGRLYELEGWRGTLYGLQELIYAASNYQAIVVAGYNSMLSPDDSEFVTGVGHWQRYINPHVVDMYNMQTDTYPPDDLHPLMVLRTYEGVRTGDVATDNSLPSLPPESGRGVMEVIEVPDA